MAGAAVRAGEAASAVEDVALGVGGGLGGGAGDRQGGDAGVGKALQFVGLADAVLINVAPEFEFIEAGIPAVDLAVFVAVPLAQGLVAGVGGGARAQAGLVAEEFVAAVYRSIGVLVDDEEGVVAGDPARGFGEGVAVVVEMDGVGGGIGGLDAVVGEVQDQGVASCDENYRRL